MSSNAYKSALSALDYCLANRRREWNSTDVRLVTEARDDLAAALATPAQAGAELPELASGITLARLAKREIAAGDCPPQSRVILLSSLHRMLAANSAQTIAGVREPHKFCDTHGCAAHKAGCDECAAGQCALLTDSLARRGGS